MCKPNGNEKTETATRAIVTPVRPLDPDYDRTPTYCIRCQMRKVQMHGLWCCECWDVLLSDAYDDETTEFLHQYDYLFSQHGGTYE